jgi:hypothetical protein
MPRIGRDRPSRDNFHWIVEDWIFNCAYIEISADGTLALGKQRFPKDPMMILLLRPRDGDFIRKTARK